MTAEHQKYTSVAEMTADMVTRWRASYQKARAYALRRHEATGSQWWLDRLHGLEDVHEGVWWSDDEAVRAATKGLIQ